MEAHNNRQLTSIPYVQHHLLLCPRQPRTRWGRHLQDCKHWVSALRVLPSPKSWLSEARNAVCSPLSSRRRDILECSFLNNTGKQVQPASLCTSPNRLYCCMSMSGCWHMVWVLFPCTGWRESVLHKQSRQHPKYPLQRQQSTTGTGNPA